MFLYSILTPNMIELSPPVYISVIHRHEDTLELKLLYIQDLIQKSLCLSTSSYLTSPTLSSHCYWNCFLAFVNFIVCWLIPSFFWVHQALSSYLTTRSEFYNPLASPFPLPSIRMTLSCLSLPICHHSASYLL